jgi:hypothetical protein
MSTFLIVHRAPKGYVGSGDFVTAWNAFFEGLGSNLVDRGNPVFQGGRTLGNCVTDTVLGAYTIVSANDLEVAVALASESPILREGGGVEVGELAMMP